MEQIKRYLLAMIAVAVASAITRGTWPLLSTAPLALDFAAVIIAGWWGGLWPGLTATMLAVVGWLAFPPGHDGLSASLIDPFVEFSAASFVISWLSGARLRAVGADEERKRLLLQLEMERARLEAVLQQLPVGVAIVEAPSGRLLLHNDEAERLLGHPMNPSDAPDYYPLFGAIHPDGRPFGSEDYPSARAISRGEVIASECIQYRHDDGSLTYLSVNSAPIRDSDGCILAAVTVFLDITDRKRAEEERTELLRRIVSSQEDERRRIARELHDQMGQHITALMLWIKALGDGPDEATAERGRRFQQLRGMIDMIGREAHRIALELRPTALDDLGLHSALLNHVEEWSERYRIDVDFQSSGLDHCRLKPHVETAIYRIVQEALTNVVKHARAAHVALVLENGPEHLLAIVEDDGVGFDAGDAPRPGMGLLGMRERVTLVGGTLQVESAPGGGTTLLIRIPRPGDSEGGERGTVADSFN